jgi:hypothetical protein
MNLDDAYGIIALPLRILQNAEEALQLIGIALPAWASQSILFLGAGILGFAAWRWMLKLTGWDAKRIVVLFIALAISMVAVAIPLFWVQFISKPPTGVVLGKIEGSNDGGWELELFDTRNRKMKREDITGVQGEFGLYYNYSFGQVPSHVLVHHRDCASPFEIKLTKGEVFAASRMRLELRCKP